MRYSIRLCASALLAGSITGILGSGGGMFLYPMLISFCSIDVNDSFFSSLFIMVPVCFVSAIFQAAALSFSFLQVLPFCLGGLIGGVLASFLTGRISVTLLNRIFSLILLWSGFRCLFS